MMFTVRNDSLDPYENLAREEYLLKHRKMGDYLLLWRNRPSVIIGRNQVAGEEVRMTYARAHGIPVVRRMSGGGVDPPLPSAGCEGTLRAGNPGGDQRPK